MARQIEICSPCGLEVSHPTDRHSQLLAQLEHEAEPLILLTHLLRWCRDEHRVLRESDDEPSSRVRVAEVVASLRDLLPGPGAVPTVDPALRRAFAEALQPHGDVPQVVVASALARILDERFAHTFHGSFERRSPYQPGVGDPVPLDSPDIRGLTRMTPTSPPWRLANRLDETRHIRLAGDWVVQFRLIFDYSASDALAGLISSDTILATCHPNRSLAELELGGEPGARTYPVRPRDLTLQRREINQLVQQACDAGASIVVLPELCLTEELALEMEAWVRRPDGPRLLIAGSYHHEDNRAGTRRRRNTALGWLRGHDIPLAHDKHSPGAQPILEDIQPQGWPEIRVYVTAEGLHLVIAICRDLLNPSAVHVLTEVGANLVLVPAMSETLTAFGGPAAHLVGSCQALVAVSNNPADWSTAGDPHTRHPARALFGHPGLGQQTKLVQPPDLAPGVALMRVQSGQITWLSPQDETIASPGTSVVPSDQLTPAWVDALAREVGAHQDSTVQVHSVDAFHSAAVLVLLTQCQSEPCLLLTTRAADLTHYPGEVSFPGGMVEATDSGPIEAALREAHEEVGLDPASLTVLGVMSPMALPSKGLVVYPVFAWASSPVFDGSVNYAEVQSVSQVPLTRLASRRAAPTDAQSHRSVDGTGVNLGGMTASVIDALLGAAVRNSSIAQLALQTPPGARDRRVAWADELVPR